MCNANILTLYIINSSYHSPVTTVYININAQYIGVQYYSMRINTNIYTITALFQVSSDIISYVLTMLILCTLLPFFANILVLINIKQYYYVVFHTLDATPAKKKQIVKYISIILKTF